MTMVENNAEWAQTGDTAWDAYACPTKNMPGYDENNHWVGFKTQIELDEEKYGDAQGNQRPNNSSQSIQPACSSRRSGLSGVSKKAEPNWSFRDGNGRREPNWSSKQGNENRLIGNSRLKGEPNWSFKQGNTKEPNWSFKQQKSVPRVGRKPEPSLLRDKSGDTARLMGISKLKQFTTDDISPMPEMGHTPNFGRLIVSGRKPEPNLLRDKSADTARLSWSEGSEKISPFTRQKKGMTLTKRGKKTGKLVSDKRLDHTHIHRKRIL